MNHSLYKRKKKNQRPASLTTGFRPIFTIQDTKKAQRCSIFGQVLLAWQPLSIAMSGCLAIIKGAIPISTSFLLDPVAWVNPQRRRLALIYWKKSKGAHPFLGTRLRHLNFYQ